LGEPLRSLISFAPSRRAIRGSLRSYLRALRALGTRQRRAASIPLAKYFVYMLLDIRQKLADLKKIKDTASLTDFLFHFKCFRSELNNYLLTQKSIVIERTAKELNDFFLITSEIILSAELLKNTDSFDNIVENHYIFSDFRLKSQIFAEIAAAKNIKTIAFIGCGSCPTAAMAAALAMPNCNIIAIDTDADSLERAKKIWQQFNFTSNCNFICIKGEEFDFEGIDMLYIPCFVAAKNLILIRYLQKNNTALVENPIQSYQLFYTPIDEKLLQKLSITFCNQPNPIKNINHHLLYLQKRF
jgi:hypothetical protein